MLSRWRRTGAVAAILLGITTSALMQTMLATAMPQIVTELGGDALYGWVFTAYLLGATLTLPIFGQLADRWGSRPVYLFGVGLYAVGTALTALSPTMGLLVASRTVQGLGAGALVPAALAGVARISAGRRGRGSLFGFIGIIQVVANIAGPLVGGWFTDGPGWRWSLWLVVPFAVAAAVLAVLSFTPDGELQLVPALRSVAPLEPMRQLQAQPALRSATAGAFALGVVLVSATALVPLLAQMGMGRSASEAGAVLAPLMVGVGVGSMVGGRLVGRVGHLTILLAWLLIALGSVGLAIISTQAQAGGSLGWAMGSAAVVGVGIGSIQPILLIRSQEAAAADQVAAAGALVPFARNLGGAAGTAALGLVVLAPDLRVGLAWAFSVLAAVAVAAVIGLRWRPEADARLAT
ncbi:MAG: MFS transporter [Propioniciclava sp.]